MERTERERVTAREVAIQPFEVVVDHPRNCDVLMQSIPNCRLRSAVSASKPVIDVKTGEPRIPTDQAKHLGQIPPIPGMHLRVDPANLTYEITDPLYEDEDTCERLRQAINHSDINQRISGKLRGVKPQGGTLDMHRMKTLCREVVWLLDAGDVKVVTGKRITLEDTDALPGNYLMNPGSRVQNGQPIFEKDFSRWYERLTAQGG
jgi:hypothetical protein